MNRSVKYSLIFSCLFAYISAVSAQEWMKNLPPNKEVNFYDIQKAFNSYWNEKTAAPREADNIEDGGYQQFNRWEKFMEPRVYPTGNFNSLALFNEYKKYCSSALKASEEKTMNSWVSLGPNRIPRLGGGMGRINVVEFNPQNPAIMWAGAASGGLWKTINGGTTWTSNTDLLPNISVADIAINPVNTNIMYVATGDGYGYEAGGSNFSAFWGGTYSAGVLKSVDGGTTWDTTGLTYTQLQNNIIQRILINPVNPQIIIAAARDGLWRSTDAGASWTNVLIGHVFDLEFNTGNAGKIYAAKKDDVYVSIDTGQTWTPLSVGYTSNPGRVNVAVTAANANCIYVLTSFGELYQSLNGGYSFLDVGPADAGYGYYNTIINVSPLDENTLYTYGLNVSKSTDGGQSWTTVSDWAGWPAVNYDHADGHDIKFFPHGNDTVYSCNDGGIFRSVNGGSSWTDISSNISIAQFYRLSCSQTNPNIVYCGQQDNGSVKYDGHNWDQKLGGDGMEQLVDYLDSNKVFSSYQNGSISLSIDGGYTYIDISPDAGGDWTTPIVIDPSNNQNYYIAYSFVYESNDGGYSYYPISGAMAGGPLSLLAVAPSNSNYIYTGDNNKLYRTTNDGATWTNITAGLQLANAALTSIAVSNTNPLKIWVTLSGYSNGKKVFKSVDGGTTWTNVSGTLSNVPVNCIVYVNNTDDELFIGTDFGVFHRDNSMTDWVPYNNGLPHVIVDELEIQYSSKKLRAATYGRGLWETDIHLSGLKVEEQPISNSISVFPNPARGVFQVKSSNLKIERLTVINLLGEKVYQLEVNNQLASIDLTNFSKGVYFVKVTDEKNSIFTRKVVIE